MDSSLQLPGVLGLSTAKALYCDRFTSTAKGSIRVCGLRVRGLCSFRFRGCGCPVHEVARPGSMPVTCLNAARATCSSFLNFESLRRGAQNGHIRRALVHSTG